VKKRLNSDPLAAVLATNYFRGPDVSPVRFFFDEIP
jgi:hypothetical protein